MAFSQANLWRALELREHRALHLYWTTDSIETVVAESYFNGAHGDLFTPGDIVDVINTSSGEWRRLVVGSESGSGPSMAIASDGSRQNPKEETADFTLSPSHAHGGLVKVNSGSAVVVTVPPNTFPTGQRIDILRYGAGSVTINPGSGVTISRASDRANTIRARYEAASLWKEGTNNWVLFGALT